MTHTNPQPEAVDAFFLDPAALVGRTVTAVRVAFGVAGAIALIIGIAVAVWPEKTLVVLAVVVGIYFLAVGVVRVLMGLFATGMSGGLRALSVILGLLLVAAGILALRNADAAATVLATFVVALMGIGWIVEGVVALAESGRSRAGGWAIAYGIVSVLAGVAVLLVPVWTAVVLTAFTGVVLIVLGIIGIVRAITFGRGIAPAVR